MTMPGDESAERETGPLGSDVGEPAADGDTDGAAPEGIAGPSYPPEETEPDAR